MEKRVTRREFVKAGTAAAAIGVAEIPMAYAGGQEPTLSVGLVGCGGRGTGAAGNCLESSQNVRLVAMGDMFRHRLEQSQKQLRRRDGYKVDPDRSFIGFDAYKKVIDSGIDMVILTTPPGFRPMMFEYAIEKGKHVFFEKPVGVDPTGIRKVIEVGKKAKEKGLAVVAGTQRRHQRRYNEVISRIHDGAIGEVTSARVYWNGGGVWTRPRKPGQSDMEYQIQNWYYYTWLCGDHIVEQHIHNLDVASWVLGDKYPKTALAVGGRQQRTGKDHGHIYDHFAVDFEFEDGATVLSMCRHWRRCANNVSERVIGTKGKSDGGSYITGPNEYRFPRGKDNKPYVQEHTDLIKSIREKKPLNEAERVAKSTLIAIMGREAAYTGKVLKWDEFLNSPLNLMPEKLEFGPLPEPEVAIPGRR